MTDAELEAYVKAAYGGDVRKPGAPRWDECSGHRAGSQPVPLAHSF